MNSKIILTTAIILITLLLTGCGAQKEINEPVIDVKTQIANGAKAGFGQINPDIEITQRGNSYDVTATYNPSSLYKRKMTEADKEFALASNLQYQVAGISNTNPNVDKIKIILTTNSANIGVNHSNQYVISENNNNIVRQGTIVKTSREEFQKYGNKFRNHVSNMMVVHPFYQIEQSITTGGVFSPFYVDVVEIDNVSTATLTYKPPIEGFANLKFDAFENQIANTVRMAFQNAETIDKVHFVMIRGNEDNRTNYNKTIIAEVTLTREEYEVITNNWDNLRSQILDKISYNPMYIADMAAETPIELFDYGLITQINLVLNNYENVETTINTMEKDATELAYALTDKFPEIERLIIRARIWIPAPEGEVTIDGVHKIVENGFSVSMPRSEIEKINREVLDYKQVLFIFEPTWDKEILKKNLERAGFSGYTRSVELSADGTEAKFFIDSCKWKSIVQNKAVGVRNQLFKIAKDAMFNIHPPYLETVSVYAQKVFLNKYGQEDVNTLAMITIERDKDAYWFNPDIEDIDSWYLTKTDENNIDDETVLCQIMNT